MPGTHGLAEGSYAYVTLHRPSNVDEPGRLEEALGLLEAVGSQLPVVFPVHPRTRGRLEAAGCGIGPGTPAGCGCSSR
jgi:UDP-N-acetylglucosamine 2-epimerase (non-hydrolysing)